MNAFGPATAVAIGNGRGSARAAGAYVAHRSAAGLRVQVFFGSGIAFTARLADIRGRTLASHSGQGPEEFLFPQGGLPPGMHILEIRSGKETYTSLGFK